MLTLNLNEGEYITVGDNIVIQAYPEGKRVTLRVDAPREIPVLRGSLQEKGGAPKPEALAQAGERKSRAKAKSMGQQLRNERYFEKVDRWQARKDAARDAFETFQPHFYNIVYTLYSDSQNRTVLTADNVKALHKSKLFKSFKYIKTFTPMRRFTTSHGATVKFMYSSTQRGAEEMLGEKKKDVILIVPDAVSQRVLNRSYMADPDDRLYKDSIVVRFEDGKLNPKATFSALAAFLDLPYTESMTYCSEQGKHDVESYEGNVRGFDPATVYRTYDEYVNDNERKYIEYFLRDAYAYYGYDFQYYDGEPVSEEQVKAWVSGFERIDHYIRKTWIRLYEKRNYTFSGKDYENSSEAVKKALQDAIPEALMKRQLDDFRENRIKNAEIMERDLHFVNMTGKPLKMTPILQLDPALLENPVYH